MGTVDSAEIREAREADVVETCELFRAAYGEDYAFPQYFDPDYLKRLVFNDDCLLLVAEAPSGQLVGTGSVVYDVGSFTDLVGEFGRLVVHPDGRGQGLGNRLMEERLRRAGEHLHVALADNRVAHPYSQKISLRYGFVPVGYLPIHNGEPVVLFMRHFNGALQMRRNHPHLAAELADLADVVLRSVGMEPDCIVDASRAAYPDVGGFELEEMSGAGYAALLRFERGRYRNRDIFGPVKLHFGRRALARHHASYLIAKKHGEPVAAIGYARDQNIDRAVRIFELIYRTERPIRFLLQELERRCREEWQVDYLETDVSADSPRMQKTLLELGFLPLAYMPSGVFHNVERLDTIRMARYYVPVKDQGLALAAGVEPLVNEVVGKFRGQWIEPLLAELLPQTELFAGLNGEQTARLANLFERVEFSTGDWLLAQGREDGAAYVITAGRAAVVRDQQVIDEVGAGEFVGELALLNHAAHSAGVRASEAVVAARIRQGELETLLQTRSDLGFIVYRNLARGLGVKLRRRDGLGG